MQFRTEKNTNYVCIHRGFLSDKNLSYRAKGLLAYLLTSDEREFNLFQLQSISTEGRDAIYSAIKELINAGYVSRKLNRTKGKFEKGVYEIRESNLEKPFTENQNEIPQEIS